MLKVNWLASRRGELTCWLDGLYDDLLLAERPVGMIAYLLYFKDVLLSDWLAWGLMPTLFGSV